MASPLCVRACVPRYQLGDFTGEVLSEVTVPLAEKPAYIAPVSLANGMRHKTELKIKVRPGETPPLLRPSGNSILECDKVYTTLIHNMTYSLSSSTL